ncbi:MAG: hypothetical protein IT337_10780 [Thermomicrobiales bacterium]|nr:hypothetical protein [Thermomicrobiales bacterium]
MPAPLRALQQRASENVAALAADRVDADPYELALLQRAKALSARLVEGGLTRREAAELLAIHVRLEALNDAEDADHAEALPIAQALTGSLQETPDVTPLRRLDRRYRLEAAA